MRKATLMCVLLVIALHASAADFQLELRLTARTLVAGLSPGIEVDVTNVSNRRLPTPLSAAMIVTPLDGRKPFVAGGIVPVSDDWNEYLRELAPRQRTTLLFPATLSLMNPAFFADERLEQPGSYRLQLSFVPHGMWHEALLADPQKGWLTNAVTFTVAEPIDDDAKVCELASARLQIPGCPVRSMLARVHRYFDLIRQLADEYPRSSYTPYFLYVSRVDNDAARIALYESIIARIGAESPLADWYRWHIAQLHEIGSFDRNIPAVESADHGARAEAIWRRLRESKQAALRHHANHKLRELAESTDTPDPN